MADKRQTRLTIRIDEELKKDLKKLKPKGKSWNLFLKELLYGKSV